MRGSTGAWLWLHLGFGSGGVSSTQFFSIQTPSSRHIFRETWAAGHWTGRQHSSVGFKEKAGSEDWPGNQDTGSRNTSHVTTSHQFLSSTNCPFASQENGMKNLSGFYWLTQYVWDRAISHQVCLPLSEGLQGHFWAGCRNLTKERNCMSPTQITRFPSDLIQVLACPMIGARRKSLGIF